MASTVTVDVPVGEDEFRASVRAFLAREAAPGSGPKAPDVDVARSKAYQAALFAAGLAGLTWPKEYGGEGVPKRYQTIFNEEEQDFAPPANAFRLAFGQILPVVLKHGTEEQNLRFVLPALRGEEI